MTYFDLDCDPALFGQLASFAKVWQAHYADGRMPAWRDFKPVDFLGLYTQLTVLEFIDTSPDPVYRFQGTRIVEDMGEDVTGRRFSDVLPQGYKQKGRTHFIHMREGGRAALIQGKLPVPGLDHRSFVEVEFPMSHNGRDVDFILSGMITRD